MKVYVDAIDLLGPGLEGWAASRPVLAGETRYVSAQIPKYVAELLPPTERRRCGPGARLAVYVAHQAVLQSELDPAALATVFASSGSDLEISQKICLALTEEQKFISPTLFHNSVHNTAVGYWSIAAGSRKNSNSLSAYDWSAAAGLLAAGAQVNVDDESVLLACFDLPVNPPLGVARPVSSAFAVALVLSPQQSTRSMWQLNLTHSAQAGTPTACSDSDLENLRTGNPAAAMLPLLSSMAANSSAQIVIAAPMDTSVIVDVQPCN